MKKNKSRPFGRPPKKVSEKNPPRQIGRWSDADWAMMRAVADHYGLSMAELVRRFVFREAKKLGLN